MGNFLTQPGKGLLSYIPFCPQYKTHLCSKQDVYLLSSCPASDLKLFTILQLFNKL